MVLQISRNKIDAGLVKAEKCSEILDQVVTSVMRVDSLLLGRGFNVFEQASGVSEINLAVSNEMEMIVHGEKKVG